MDELRLQQTRLTGFMVDLQTLVNKYITDYSDYRNFDLLYEDDCFFLFLISKIFYILFLIRLNGSIW